MKQHDAAAAHLRQPGGEVLAHRPERVVAVEMEEIDAAVGEILEGIREAGADQPRETGEVGLVIVAPLPKTPSVYSPEWASPVHVSMA